jgi:hypothetical protein
MIEDGFAHYVIICILRTLLGRRTAGLLFRPSAAVKSRSLRLRMKRSILKVLKLLPRVKTLSIVPASLDPSISSIVDGWIYDFQLWDLSVQDRQLIESLRTHQVNSELDKSAVALVVGASLKARGRKIIAAIGTQSRLKGFDLVATAAEEVNEVGWKFLVAGKIDQSCASFKAQLKNAGAILIDRFISEGEVLASYAISDAVWCCYHESYDQASGILGRAMQLGLPVIVREGSLSHRLCQSEQAPHLAVRADGDIAGVLAELPAENLIFGAKLARKFRQQSLSNLHVALGVAEYKSQ